MKMFLLALFVVGMGVMLSGCASAANESGKKEEASGYHRISPEEAKQMITAEKDLVLIDVRTPAEYQEKHIPGARLVPNETISNQPIEGGRVGAGEGRQGKQGHAAEQRPAPTKTVRQRAIDQLANGQTGEVHRQGQLDVFFIGGKRCGHRREARQVEIDRQRRKGAQGTQNQDYAKVHQAPKRVGSPTV